MKSQENSAVTPYMNPYLAGFLLGVLLLLTIFITGRGLGASGAAKSLVIAISQVFSSDPGSIFSFFQTEAPPLKSWLVFEVLGLLIGAFLSGFLSGRLRFKIDKGPRINTITRLLMAAAGGILFGLGSQLARGCTSGAALSGMAVFSTAGFLTMMAIFGTGYVIAYFFRKLWI
ncbi:MAG: YeeE/YedE thiosulfate transporter family protein [Bacteroidales bacterium]